MWRWPLVKATSRDSLPKPRPELATPGVAATNWPTTAEPPAASCAKVTSFTIVFSSRTVPHWMQTASPRAASVSISVDWQLGQVRMVGLLFGGGSGCRKASRTDAKRTRALCAPYLFRLRARCHGQ